MFFWKGCWKEATFAPKRYGSSKKKDVSGYFWGELPVVPHKAVAEVSRIGNV